MKAKAVSEVVVVFGVTLLLVALVGLSPIGKWERQVTNRAFIEYAVMIAVPLFLLNAMHRELAAYGLSLQPVSYHLNVALTAFVPVAIGDVVLSFVHYTRWGGALILAGVQIAVLFAVGWLLRRKVTRKQEAFALGAVVLIGCSNLAAKATAGNAVSALVFYVFFLGLGEELLFRGYIQSRLNAAFGRPFQFFGVRWGWGIVITAALFGLMHVLNVGGVIGGSWKPEWWWGFWTFFAGLVLGFVREKTGSITASTILHGLPQGIAYAFLGL